MAIYTSDIASSSSVIERVVDVQRTKNMLSILEASPTKGMVKTASTDVNSDEVIKQVAKALAAMGVKVNIDLGELMKQLSATSMKKEAKETESVTQEVVKIASKKIQDSHYDIDLAKSSVVHDGKKIILVSFYMREAYLGRYLIKRNYYFLPDNETDATYVFDDLLTKSKRTRDRYYNEKIGVKAIFPEVKAFLDGARGDLELDNDKLGTTVTREDTRGHEVNGPANTALAHK